MYGIRSKLLKEIANCQKFLHAGRQAMFAMDEVRLVKARDDQIATLQKSGVSSKVATLYAKLAPLLAENEAISHNIIVSGEPSRRQTPFEITSVAEALKIAEMENTMSDQERSSLATLLEPLAHPPGLSSSASDVGPPNR